MAIKAHQFGKEIPKLGVDTPGLNPLAQFYQKDLIAHQDILKTEKQGVELLLWNDVLHCHRVPVLLNEE